MQPSASNIPGQTVRIVEVSPRDGLQNHPGLLPTATKLSLIKRLQSAGLKTLELTSLVSARSIPQLADASVLLADPGVQAMLCDPSLRTPVLVPNLRGLQTALRAGVREIALFVSATEGFSRANIRCSVDEAIRRAEEVMAAVQMWRKQQHQQGHSDVIQVRAYVSCIFEDPFDGPTDPRAVVRVVKALLAMGCYEVSLGDTLGVGTAAKVKTLLEMLEREAVPMRTLAGHFHDTYGQALANVWEAYRCGVRVFDSSVGGLGGCPFAPGAKGNVATEDVVYMFEQAGISTGVNLQRLVEVGAWISAELKKSNDSRAGVALLAAAKRKVSSTTGNPSPNGVTTPRHRLTWTTMSTGSMQAGTDDLQILRSGVNVKVLLNRPRNGNALTASMIDSLTSFFRQASTDANIRRIAITGSPDSKHFCTGMDLSKDTSPVAREPSSSSSSSTSTTASDAQYTRLTTLLRLIDEAPQVTIAALNGPAYGGGVGLALACDIRIASRDAALTLSEVTLGLSPATISPYVVRELGFAVAREAMLSGRRIGVVELRRLGVVSADAVVAGEGQQQTLENVLDARLVDLGGAAPGASSMVKDLVRVAWRDGGGAEQEARVKELFGKMMRKGGESEYGLKAWQAGKKVRWDELPAAAAAAAPIARHKDRTAKL